MKHFLKQISDWVPIKASGQMFSLILSPSSTKSYAQWTLIRQSWVHSLSHAATRPFARLRLSAAQLPALVLPKLLSYCGKDHRMPAILDKNANPLSEMVWRRAILPPHATIEQAIRNLDQVAIKIILVVNEKAELVGTISDGDIRRGLLKGLNFSSTIESVIHRNALVVPPGMGRDMVMQLMVANHIHQIPVVDEHHHV